MIAITASIFTYSSIKKPWQQIICFMQISRC